MNKRARDYDKVILAYIVNNPGISQTDLIEELSITRGKARYNLKKLQEKHMIVTDPPVRAGGLVYYHATDKGKRKADETKK